MKRKWITTEVPSDLKIHKGLSNTLTSDLVVVLVSNRHEGNYPCIGQYTVNTDPEINKEQGHWRLTGHNGNWDKRIIGWYPIPDI